MCKQNQSITFTPEQIAEFNRGKSILWQALGMAEIIATHQHLDNVDIITLQSAVKGIHALLLEGLTIVEEV